MIRSFRHKALKHFYSKGSAKGISAQMVGKVRRVLDAIDAADSPQDLTIPGFGTHELKGNRKGTWSITITGNWRITFQFDGVDVVNVNLEDYH